MTIKERTNKAIANGMHLIGKGHMKVNGQQFWLVSSEHTPDKGYVVSQGAGHLDCNCPATKPCKHICFVSRLLNAERTDAAQPIPDAAKWALIEQVMPDRYAEMQQAAHEATAMLAELVEKLHGVQLDEHLWGEEHTDAPAPKSVPSCSNCRQQPADPAIRGQLCSSCHEKLTAQMQARQEAKRRETAMLDTDLRFDPLTGLALTGKAVA